MVVEGDYAYVASYYNGGLSVVDISNPSSISVVGSLQGSAQSVAVVGDYAYMPDWDEGFRVIDISTLSSPTEVGSCAIPKYTYSVVVAGDYAYIAASASGLRVVDVSNPSAPIEVGYYNTGDARGVTVAGDLVYVADHYGGLIILRLRKT